MFRPIRYHWWRGRAHLRSGVHALAVPWQVDAIFNSGVECKQLGLVRELTSYGVGAVS